MGGIGPSPYERSRPESNGHTPLRRRQLCPIKLREQTVKLLRGREGSNLQPSAPEAAALSITPRPHRATARPRTADLRLTMATLCHLSYCGMTTGEGTHRQLMLASSADGVGAARPEPPCVPLPRWHPRSDSNAPTEVRSLGSGIQPSGARSEVSRALRE